MCAMSEQNVLYKLIVNRKTCKPVRCEYLEYCVCALMDLLTYCQIDIDIIICTD